MNLNRYASIALLMLVLLAASPASAGSNVGLVDEGVGIYTDASVASQAARARAGRRGRHGKSAAGPRASKGAKP